MSFSSSKHDQNHYYVDRDKIVTNKHESDSKIKKYKSIDTFEHNFLLPNLNSIRFIPSDETNDYIVEREPIDHNRNKKFVKRQIINRRDEHSSKLNSIKSCIFFNADEGQKEPMTSALRIKNLHFIPKKVSKQPSNQQKYILTGTTSEFVHQKGKCKRQSELKKVVHMKNMALTSENGLGTKDLCVVNPITQSNCSKCVRQRAAVGKLAQLAAEMKKLLNELRATQLSIEEKIVDWEREWRRVTCDQLRARENIPESIDYKPQIYSTHKQLLIQAVIRDVQKVINIRLGVPSFRESKIGKIVANTTLCLGGREQLKQAKQSDVFKQISLDLSRVSSHFTESSEASCSRIHKIKQELNEEVDFDKTVLKR